MISLVKVFLNQNKSYHGKRTFTNLLEHICQHIPTK